VSLEGIPTLISHAHSDHVPKNLASAKSDVFVTEGTSSILRRLYGGDYKLLNFNEGLEIDGIDIYAFPSGHIFGSAGFLINCEKISLFYTGDVNLHGGLTVESPARIPKSDVLVIEATYGLPKFRFPNPEVTRARLAKWAIREMMKGGTPVISAYLVGKSQEVIALLNKYTNLNVSVSKKIADVSEAYEKFNLKYVTNSRSSTVHVTHKIEGEGTARVTGWALFSKRDRDFPLSAHADFYDLLSIVEYSNPMRVFTIYGFAKEFADILKKIGINAERLSDIWIEL
ncbi:MAG: MBL fold metallo-hydrolase, partial [Candidatus Korarchaeum sp.]|nr:MBL fold metallo-hydrolase [Candidatus Korarchaeum sp.]